MHMAFVSWIQEDEEDEEDQEKAQWFHKKLEQQS